MYIHFQRCIWDAFTKCKNLKLIIESFSKKGLVILDIANPFLLKGQQGSDLFLQVRMTFIDVNNKKLKSRIILYVKKSKAMDL